MDGIGQSYVKRKLVGLLDEARALAEAGPDEYGPQIETLLRDALDRVVACELTQSVMSRDEGPAAFVCGQACSRIGGEPVREFRLLPFGEVEVERGGQTETFTFDREQALALVEWFEGLGRKLAIDYEHQSLDPFNTRSDGLKPAAGWIGGLEVRDDGLWAVDVVWTQQAAELLARGEYRYFSPVIYWADESRERIAALGPVALTNDPALHDVPALAASRHSGEAEARRRIAVLQRELQEAEEELWTLRQQLRAQEAEAFVERGMRLGKIVDATSMDWRQDYLRDPQGAEERLSRAPVILPPGRYVRPGAEAPPVDGGRRGPLEREDLEAYERALVAGRVCGSAAR